MLTVHGAAVGACGTGAGAGAHTSRQRSAGRPRRFPAVPGGSRRSLCRHSGGHRAAPQRPRSGPAAAPQRPAGLTPCFSVGCVFHLDLQVSEVECVLLHFLSGRLGQPPPVNVSDLVHACWSRRAAADGLRLATGGRVQAGRRRERQAEAAAGGSRGRGPTPAALRASPRTTRLQAGLDLSQHGRSALTMSSRDWATVGTLSSRSCRAVSCSSDCLFATARQHRPRGASGGEETHASAQLISAAGWTPLSVLATL